MQVYNIPDEIKCLIFDIDSTLYTNDEYAYEQIDVQVRHFASLKGITNEEARKMVSDFRHKWADEHNGAKISLGNLFTYFGITIDQSIEWRKTLIEPGDYLSKDEELIKTIDTLSKKYILICVTNNPVLPAEKTLQSLGIKNYIKTTIGLDTTKKSKPAPEPLELALNICGVTANNCVSIGDRYDIDLALPIKMGMGGILVNGVKEVYSLTKIL